jgi:hypothetical protein
VPGQLQDAAHYHTVYCELQQLQIPQMGTSAHWAGACRMQPQPDRKAADRVPACLPGCQCAAMLPAPVLVCSILALPLAQIASTKISVMTSRTGIDC